jgi:pyrimidine-nucleoside phosphorylase
VLANAAGIRDHGGGDLVRSARGTLGAAALYTWRRMRMVDVIVRKRDGASLSRQEIDFVVAGLTSGTIPDYQVAALLMAMLLRGLSGEETAWLTEAMTASGGRVDLRAIPGTKVGKHSTGGVGDKTSIVVAPLVAACGVVVPKSSGRALGHTGGTIDKLESIPGFRVALARDEFIAVLAEIGCAFVGQTGEIAPADRKMYALRDVTGTIESVPLIASSIMSKKVAEGTDALLLDVKVGRGAFMKSEAEARELALAMVGIGARVGLRTQAVLTAMDAPIGRAVGNALEVVECLETLRGRGPADLEHLCLELAARMVVLATGRARPEADALVEEALRTGAALEVFRRVVERQGGDPRVIDDYARLPGAAGQEPWLAGRDGFVTAIDALRVGRASMALGAGRDRVDAAIDPGAGIVLHVTPGDRVTRGQVIADLHVGASARSDDAAAWLRGAIEIGDEPPPPQPLVLGAVP